MEGANVLDTVFTYIKEIIAKIQQFFNDIMGLVQPEGEEAGE